MPQKASRAGAALSHETALAFWSNPLLPAALPTLAKPAAKRVLADAHGTLHAGVLDRLKAQPLFRHVPPRLDLLVPDESDHRATRRAVMHVWATPLPARALCAVDGICPGCDENEVRVTVSSPEFTFLQMAQVVGDLELAEIGFELCGGYAIAPLAPDGLVQRPAVTTPEAIDAFVRSADGAPGIMRARRASRLLVAGSSSPKETQIALLARLSRRSGGAGLPAPLLNVRIDAAGQAARVLDAAWAVPDLYWPEARVAVEYDSRAFHEGMLPAEHDARKRNAYALMGIDAFTVTAGQMADREALFSMFGDIAKRLGIRRNRPSAAMLESRARAHAFLVSGERRNRFTDPELVA